MAIKPIALSFKNTKEDLELYAWISSHSNMSGFIKDTLRAAKGGETYRKDNKSSENKKNELIDMDF